MGGKARNLYDGNGNMDDDEDQLETVRGWRKTALCKESWERQAS